jgi:hypothetical protein
MDPRERIALWVALVVLLVFVLVRSTSSFVGAQMSFVDLAEFDTLPADLKKMYYDTMVNGVAKEAGQKVTSMWAALTPAQKEEAKAQAAKQAKMVMEQIQSGKGGVMVLPPPVQQQGSAMKPEQNRMPIAEPVKIQPLQDFGMKPVQNWMPIAEPVKIQTQQGPVPIQMQGRIAEVKAEPVKPGQMQGRIAETKPMQMGPAAYSK